MMLGTSWAPDMFLIFVGFAKCWKSLASPTRFELVSSP
jgi:hypothetical protein